MNKQKQQRLLNFIFFLSILGIVLSGYLTYIHYSTLSSPCDFSETFQCSLVNQSKYAEVFGIPVALLGMMGYSFLGLVSLVLLKRKFLSKVRANKFLGKLVSVQTLFVFSIIALIVSLYLTYAEFFLIKAICIWCLISQIIILVIVGFSYKILKLNKLVEGD